MAKLKMGIIGTGGIARDRHIPAYQKISDLVTIEAVCDLNMQAAEEVAKQFGIKKVYTDYHELFQEVDAVTICTPNKFHAEITIAALEAGVHVLCEKPMAINAAECESMIEASKRAGKMLSIGFHYRFTKDALAAKRVILENEIGQPIVARVHAMRRRKVPGWGVFTNKDLQGGGSLIDWGCHFLDLSLWLLGNPKPVQVIGQSYNGLSKMPNQVNEWGAFNHETFNVDDHVTAYIKFDNGATMLFETSWSANIKEDSEGVSISGETGGIDLFPFELNQAKHGMLLNSQANWIPGDDDPGLTQVTNFVESCLGLSELIVKPEEAMQVSKIIDAIYHSSETSEMVNL
ncbi:NADH-dependent dehydrogenase [Alkalihalobacillus alcalophilus ATCC 27647 = CGMCC 1.3604]|uniref:Dehydrogenase n=1 Tax=Alkalihalobacillus alcalophilus ATCC 27647 = CGMCC 1.3604 TaxID=1218173 RepID=A0A094WI38_ALKAL|nr:Gfo/Idh/MocA family oxidoreductase [Alkalihalobacillus alcalophilus]KGA96481.1 dehydrogenase [Alkalihalobacillus alcalophilus ATCC 27647 = CGMCC 1.3604]MED1562313.1 Gfo/Idh/MocA family oxidoreductase [Alkalihalobacillus alcalophilus]THG90912.1 NADH-dependent dehydrogenase [Alkalihalobacillus alcalophilus ATCC 27647 = CGMCC 1.3604]